jgi:outer membrane protein assembly factor BamE (lipoprotein component of BamABCDE complex)
MDLGKHGSRRPIITTLGLTDMKNIIFSVLAVSLVGCSAGWHADTVQNATNGGDRLSVGKVQREIKVGMSSAEVVQVLGSPNIVSTDDERREVWVYDKIATDTAYSTSGVYGTVLILGAAGNSGAQSTNQRTLTIAIKFDKDNRVRDISYHQTSF